MLEVNFDPAAIKGYHAHVYYRSAEEKLHAAEIRNQVQSVFAIELGRWRDTPVGPHPEPMFQISFTQDDLGRILPWLMSARGNLSVLIHAYTDQDDLIDHTFGACWLGEPLALNMDVFNKA